MEDIAEQIGLLADKAENFSMYGEPDGAFVKLPPQMRIDAMFHGLTELMEELRKLSIAAGADPETWG